MPRYTWRKGKAREGMMRLPQTYTLHFGSDEILARAQRHGHGWFWYGDGQNTAGNLRPLLDVQAEAVEWFKARAARKAA